VKYILTSNDYRSARVVRAAALLCVSLCALHLAQGGARARRQPAPQVGERGQAAITATADGPNESAVEGDEARGKIEGLVESEAGRPLANATVVARPLERGGTPSLVSTDAEGRFQLTGLAPAAYRLRAFAPGYVTAAPAEGSTPDYYRPGDSASLRLIKGGVITGVVTDQAGVPLAAVRVHVTRVPGAGGREMSGRDASTDDRGIYRVYGLEAGAYLVSVSGGSNLFNSNPSLKADEQPTFYPSSPRAAATKVVVVAGQEVVGINIQRCELRGFTVSGLVEGVGGASSKGVGVALLDAATGEALETATLTGGERAFSFYNVPDGEYELVARAGAADESSVSSPRRVTLKGRDLSGVVLALRKTVVLAGRVVKPSPQPVQSATCKDGRSVRLREVVLSLRREEASGEGAAARPGGPHASEAAPDADGAFTFGGLQPGRYALGLDLPGRTFVRSISADPSAPSNKPAVQASGLSLTLTDGAGAQRLTVVLGEGAAELRGRVRAGEGARLPAALLVYLVPAAPDSADDPLRFALASTGDEGAFAFEHVAPGSYRLIALSADGARLRVEDAAARARLRREAEASGTAVSLQPCGQVEGFDLPYAARASAAGERPAAGGGSH